VQEQKEEERKKSILSPPSSTVRAMSTGLCLENVQNKLPCGKDENLDLPTEVKILG
jgi:hypothetical protein